jgi:hypothetical protein
MEVEKTAPAPVRPVHGAEGRKAAAARDPPVAACLPSTPSVHEVFTTTTGEASFVIVFLPSY